MDRGPGAAVARDEIWSNQKTEGPTAKQSPGCGFTRTRSALPTIAVRVQLCYLVMDQLLPILPSGEQGYLPYYLFLVSYSGLVRRQNERLSLS